MLLQRAKRAISGTNLLQVHLVLQILVLFHHQYKAKFEMAQSIVKADIISETWGNGWFVTNVKDRGKEKCSKYKSNQICGSMEGKENLNLLESFNNKKEEKENTGDFSKMQKRHVCVCQVKIWSHCFTLCLWKGCL